MQLTKNSENPIDVYRVKCPNIEQSDPKWPKLTKSSKIARSQLPKFNEVYWTQLNPIEPNWSKLSKMIRIQEKCPKIIQIEPKLSKFPRTQLM